MFSSRSLPFVALAFLQEAVVILAISTSEGLFLKRVGSELLPGAYILSAVVSVLTSLAYTYIRGRFDNRKLALATASGFLAVALGLQGAIASTWKPAFYVYFVAVSVYVMLSRIQLWLSINRRFTTREAKRVFPVLTGAGLAGAIAGGGSIVLLPQSWGSGEYQQVMAAVIVVYLVIFFAATRGDPRSQESQAKQRSASVLEELKQTADSRYIRNIALLILSLMMVRTLVDYQFNRAADARFVEESALIGFLALFRSLINMGAFLSQMLLTQRLILALGVGMGLLVTPAAALAYSTLMLVNFSFYTAVISKVVGRFLFRTLHGTLYQVLFNAIEDFRRDSAMLLCEGFAYSGGTILASVMLWSVVSMGSTAINLLLVLSALVFLFASMRLRSEYLAVLVSSFKSGKTPTPQLMGRLPGSAAMEVRKGSLAALARLKTQEIHPYLLEALGDPSPAIRIEAIRGLTSQGNALVLPALIGRLDQEPDDRVRSQLIQAFGRFRGDLAMDGLFRFLHDRVPRIRADLVEILGTLEGHRYARIILPSLKDSDIRVRANAILAIWRTGDDPMVRSALEVLRVMMTSDNHVERSAAAYVLGQIGSRLAGKLLGTMIEKEQHPRVLRNIVRSLGRTGGDDLVDAILVTYSLAEAPDRPIWINTLKRVGRQSADSFIRAALTGEQYVQILAIEMLGYVPEDQALDTLFDLLKNRNPDIRISALRSLTRFRNPMIEEHIGGLVVHETDERVRATALRRLSGKQSRRLFPELMRGLSSGTDRERANTVEALTALSSRLDQDKKDQILARAQELVTEAPGRLAANAAYCLWKHGHPGGSAAIRKLLQDHRVVSALHVVGQTGDSQFIDDVAPLLKAEDEEVRSRAAAVLERIGAQWNDIADQLTGVDDQCLSDLLKAYADGGEASRVYLRRALKKGTSKLAKGLEDPQIAVRLQVLDLMRIVGEPIGVPRAFALLEDPSASVRLQAAGVFARTDWKEIPPELNRFWRVEVGRIYRYVWSTALLHRVASVQMPSLMELAEALQVRARSAAAALVATLDVLDRDKNFGPISVNMDSDDPRVRAHAMEAFENLAPTEISRSILPILEHSGRNWKRLVKEYYASRERPSGVDTLFGLVRDEDEAVRTAAGEALLDLGERYILEMLEREPAVSILDRAASLAGSIQQDRLRSRREEEEA